MRVVEVEMAEEKEMAEFPLKERRDGIDITKKNLTEKLR